ncbi:hypothetical protein DM02DRAFT_189804 [Periconia macrospinosa]|uniref:Uncharacterized protein n=1 Tax=Periconia macrospinosa TaxID=97972 RepID=A0A2V1D8K3_9PLEO|nr:hypothetical protein DM02DRAFT_189804 [Periconia macrospinosa]
MDQFTNTFVLSASSNQGSRLRELREIPQCLPLDPARRRRVHKKSKAGCHTCKARRLKVSKSEIALSSIW